MLHVSCVLCVPCLPPFEFPTFGLTSLRFRGGSPEAEKPRRRVGIADRKVFARPESFARIYKIGYKMYLNLRVLKLSRLSWKFPYSLESFRTV